MPGGSVEEHLMALEKDLIAAQKRRDFSTIEALLADGFCEIGSSGRFFSRAEALHALKEVQDIDFVLEGFRFVPVAPGCVILTYLATGKRRIGGREYSTRAFRSSTWVNQQGVWRIVFHQATPFASVGMSRSRIRQARTCLLYRELARAGGERFLE
jgi:ribonuclease HI